MDDCAVIYIWKRKMRIGILSATVQEIVGVMNSIEIICKFEQPYLVYAAIVWDKEVVIAISGVGKKSAEDCARFLISKFQVDYIINIGFAGTTDNNTDIGSIVMAGRSLLNKSDRFVMCDMLLGQAENARVVNITTVDDFCILSKRSSIQQLYVAMEGYGVGAECKRKGIYFDEIRCVSDYGSMEQLMSNAEICSVNLGEAVISYLQNEHIFSDRH